MRLGYYSKAHNMTDFFPTTHSVLDNQAVGRACAEQYGFDEQPYCQLFHRGMNDVYVLRTRKEQYAVRAWRINFRSMDDVAYELEYLAFLKSKGMPVAAGTPTTTGASHFVVQAPEGPRALAAFEWVPGVKVSQRIDRDLAVRLGSMMADIHLAGMDFAPSKQRRTNAVSLVADNLPYLERMVANRPDDLAFYRELTPRLIEAVEAIDPGIVPMGACHGDFHLHNGHINERDEVTFLDFDNAGDDYYAQDVMCFCWANEFMGNDSIYADYFVEGYEQRRKLSDAERDLLPLFISAKEFRLLTGFAKHVNAVGPFIMNYQNLDWFSTSVRKHAREAGLL